MSINRRRAAFTLVEIMIAFTLSVLVIGSVVGLALMAAKVHKSVFRQQIALCDAKRAIETINREIRLATTPLRLVDADGNSVLRGNRVLFSRPGETSVRSIELRSTDAEIKTPWDNTLVYDPNTAIQDDEQEICRYISPSDTTDAFGYVSAATPLVVQMRTGDPVDPTVAGVSDLYTGMDMQGFEINITVAPRN